MQKTGYPSIDKIHLQGIPEEKLHPEILPVSMFATFMKVNSEHLEEAAVEVDGEVYTKQQLKDDAMKFAGLLLKYGIKPGDKIIVTVPDSYEGIVATFGANAIGVKVVYTHAVDEADIKPFCEELDVQRPKLVLFYDNSAVSSAWISIVQAYARQVKVFLVASIILNK